MHHRIDKPRAPTRRLPPAQRESRDFTGERHAPTRQSRPATGERPAPTRQPRPAMGKRPAPTRQSRPAMGKRPAPTRQSRVPRGGCSVETRKLQPSTRQARCGPVLIACAVRAGRALRRKPALTPTRVWRSILPLRPMTKQVSPSQSRALGPRCRPERRHRARSRSRLFGRRCAAPATVPR